MSERAYEPLFVREGTVEAWRPWFAWWPVWMKDARWPYARQKRVWGRMILRRRFYAAGWFLSGNIWWWQYAEPDFSPAKSTENTS